MYKVVFFKFWRHLPKGPVPLFYSVDSDFRIWRCRCRTWIYIYFGGFLTTTTTTTTTTRFI